MPVIEWHPKYIAKITVRGVRTAHLPSTPPHVCASNAQLPLLQNAMSVSVSAAQATPISPRLQASQPGGGCCWSLGRSLGGAVLLDVLLLLLLLHAILRARDDALRHHDRAEQA